MKLLLFYTCLLIISSNHAQVKDSLHYDSSKEYPYGRMNTKAPKELKDYKLLIGISDCESTSILADGTWSKPVKMTWKFKYALNGMAIQDEALMEDGNHSGSIRRYSFDKDTWYVHWYSIDKISADLSFYHGNKKGNNIVLYKRKVMTDGENTFFTVKVSEDKEAFYRLTFYNISNDSFDWVGEWVDENDVVLGATWKIKCKKTNN